MPSPQRLVTLTGDAQQRGAQLAEQASFEINSLLELKSSKYSSMISKIRPTIESFCRSAQKHTPICFQELESLANHLQVEIYDLLLLSFEYEVWMENYQEKCTGFYSQTTDGSLIMGQTNDEDPEDWFSAECDKVISLTDENNLKSLIYTHPGIPAYMGMNSDGLVVLWQYVDNGERNYSTGVPTTAIIRELLTKQSLSSATEFVKSVPHAVPNNFILGQQGYGGVNVECTPSKIICKELKNGSFCHANHFLTDPGLIELDIGVKRPASTSINRQNKIQSLLPSDRLLKNAEEAQNILNEFPITNERTLASMVFLPSRQEMRICFMGESSKYEVYKL